MVDRQSEFPGRCRIVTSSGSSSQVTILRDDGPIEEGTPLNAATLCKPEILNALGLPETGTPSDVFDYLVNRNTGIYVVRGDIVTSNSDLTGTGSVTLLEISKNLYKLDFSYRIRANKKPSSDNFQYGLDRDVIGRNTGIYLTPTTGGYWDKAGDIAWDTVGYGTLMTANYKYWTPGRIYTTSGSNGIWPTAASVNNENSCIRGTCYGIIS